MQVKADFQENNSNIPALGLAWSHCVNTRLSLHRDSTAQRAACPPPLSSTGEGGDEDEAAAGETVNGAHPKDCGNIQLGTPLRFFHQF